MCVSVAYHAGTPWVDCCLRPLIQGTVILKAALNLRLPGPGLAVRLFVNYDGHQQGEGGHSTWASNLYISLNDSNVIIDI